VYSYYVTNFNCQLSKPSFGRGAKDFPGGESLKRPAFIFGVGGLWRSTSWKTCEDRWLPERKKNRRRSFPDAWVTSQRLRYRMKQLAKHLLALSVLFSFTPPNAIVLAANIQPQWLNQDPHHEHATSNGFPFLRWLRDSAIEIFLGRSKSSLRTKTHWVDPAMVHARYQHDVVVRFNVTNPEEEDALSKAAQQMLLDVWSFTPEYVDIRIHKDDVRPLLTLLPSSLQPTLLMQDVAAAVWATYPSKSASGSQLDSILTRPTKMKTLADGADNIFFSDYQPLAVSNHPCGLFGRKANPRIGH